MNNRIILITYGDEAYEKQRQIVRKTAIQSGFFDQVDVYTPDDVDQKFKNEFERILMQKRGGGYWIWKPYFVKKALMQCNDNDIIVYVDAGCLVNKKGKVKFEEYIAMLHKTPTGSLAFGSNHQEIKYTNKKVLDYFKSDDLLKYSQQLMATAFLIRKCNHSIMLIEKWYQTLFEDADLFTDLYNSAPQDVNFIDHRHDQSVFSLIRKIHGSENISSDETYFNDFVRDGKLYPIWATRLKDNNSQGAEIRYQLGSSKFDLI